MSHSSLVQKVTTEAVECIQSGGIILYPTETVWGLGCDATNDKAIKRIFEIKQRQLDKKMIVLIAEKVDIYKMVANPPIDVLDIMESYETPTSFVFEDVIGLSPLLLDEGRGALRVARTPLDRAIVKQSERAIVSTSANVSGMPTPVDFRDISKSIKSQVDYIIEADVMEYKMSGTPSDIVYIRPDGSTECLR